jgi:hypothetical protein
MRVSEIQQPEDVELEKQNSISYNSFYNRVYNLGWPIKRAANEPLKKRSECSWYQYRDICKAHGVTKNAFYQRQYAGWTIEQACTIPMNTTHGGLLRGRPNARLSQKELDIALSNGIGRHTAKARVHIYHWPVEKAITEPVKSQYRRKS